MPASQTVRARPRADVALAGMFTATGVLHFLRPHVFDTIVPPGLPGSGRMWTHMSGAVELLLAALVASGRYRNLGGLLAAAFLLAVFPANLRTLRVVRRKPLPVRLIALVRLPLQAPLIALALRVGRSEGDAR